MKKIILGGLLSVACVTAQADFLNGNMLLQRINSPEPQEKSLAIGYVMGISDVAQDITHCSGPNVTSGQSRDIVKKFLTARPELRDIEASVLVQVALGEAFPCQQKPKKGMM